MRQGALAMGILGTMVLLAAADIALVEGLPSPQGNDAAGEEDVIEHPLDSDERIAKWLESQSDAPDSPTPDASSVSPPPDGGVRKYVGPDVLEILTRKGFTFKDTAERTVLAKVVPDDPDVVEAKVILKDGDRAGIIAWVTSPDVKAHYLTVKEALHVAFTPEVRDIVDETQQREGRPTRNFLSFMDPGLLPERVVFIRIRERLFEFHVAEEQGDAVFDLIEELTE